MGRSVVLGVAARPLALVYAISPSEFAIMEPLFDGGLLYGFASTVSAMLIVVSIGCFFCDTGTILKYDEYINTIIQTNTGAVV